MPSTSSDGTMTITDEDASDIESDGAELADELGQIGVNTVDGDKVEAPVEDIEIVGDNTVRLWYRFPTGEYVPEEFEKPIPWNTAESKLARIIEATGLTPASFSRLKTSDVKVPLKKKQTAETGIDIEELVTSVESIAGEVSETPTGELPDELLLNEGDDDELYTWQVADPRRFGDLYPHQPTSDFEDDDETADADTGSLRFKEAVGKGLINSVILAPIIGFVILLSNVTVPPALIAALTSSDVLTWAGVAVFAFIGYVVASLAR